MNIFNVHVYFLFLQFGNIPKQEHYRMNLTLTLREVLIICVKSDEYNQECEISLLFQLTK